MYESLPWCWGGKNLRFPEAITIPNIFIKVGVVHQPIGRASRRETPNCANRDLSKRRVGKSKWNSIIGCIDKIQYSRCVCVSEE